MAVFPFDLPPLPLTPGTRPSRNQHIIVCSTTFGPPTKRIELAQFSLVFFSFMPHSFGGGGGVMGMCDFIWAGQLPFGLHSLDTVVGPTTMPPGPHVLGSWHGRPMTSQRWPARRTGCSGPRSVIGCSTLMKSRSVGRGGGMCWVVCTEEEQKKREGCRFLSQLCSLRTILPGMSFYE